jgi:hypothetical protein
MSIARSAAEVLRDHVVLELEAIDRMYTPIPSVSEKWLARAGGNDSCCGHDSRRLS